MPTASTSDGFLDIGGKLTTLQFPGSTFTQALGINNQGQVSGFYNDANSASHGFTYNHGFWTSVDAPGATATTLNGINDHGQVVGFDTDSSGATNGITSALPSAMIADTTTKAVWQQTLTDYTGPVTALSSEIIDVTPDSLNMTAESPNVFLHSGAGEDALQALSGTNVLDGGTGSNFLVGAASGAGSDTFFVDDRGANADTWSTMVNFRSGDAVTVWGITPQDFAASGLDGQGAAGYTGLTAHITSGGHPTASLTLPGYTVADLTSGKLGVSFGTDPASGSPLCLSMRRERGRRETPAAETRGEIRAPQPPAD